MRGDALAGTQTQLNGPMHNFVLDAKHVMPPQGAAVHDLVASAGVCRKREFTQLARLAAPIVITMMSHQGMVITDQVRAQNKQAC
jgi:Na+-driven multidrug efflux pump